MIQAKDMTFEYYIPRRSSTKQSTKFPMKIRKSVKGSSVIGISMEWLKSQQIEPGDISMQLKDRNDTYFIFDPPSNAPRIAMRKKSKDTEHWAEYYATDAVVMLFNIFLPQAKNTTEPLWLEYVGKFAGESKVYRVRNIQPTDKL